MINRVILIVLDSVGIGALPDADQFGDKGANTLGNISKAMNGLNLPNLQQLGLGNIDGIEGILPVPAPIGAFGKAAEVSNGKDTTTGHWEIAGIHVTQPFQTFPNGFPPEIIQAFEKKIKRKVIGNQAASGTTILDELGQVQMETGAVIVYTSADSVFQIAAHEEVVPLTELYEICQVARELMMGDYAVARVIARPFVGQPGSWVRTANRRDFSLEPFSKTVLDIAKENKLDVVAIGKIDDIFTGKGITEAVHTKSNEDGIQTTINYLKQNHQGIVFTNLVDFDSQYGHRRDPQGYGKALMDFDKRLPDILENLKPTDLLMITADHGNDPTFAGTDHTREYIPLLIYGNQVRQNVNLGIRKSFSDIAATISAILDIPSTGKGQSFHREILK